MSLKKSKSPKEPKDENAPKRSTVFDHVKHIRQVKDPEYYNNLTEDNRKSFNHFMILRALSMDAELVETMAQLYQIFDKIPSPQFYQLLIAIVPRSNRFCPWVKSKVLRNNKDLLELVAKRFKVAKYQANEYVNLLLRSEAGQVELGYICKAYGLSDKEVEDLCASEKE